MTDNLFDRLAELFQSSGPVNWRMGREIAESVAGTAEPVEPWLAEELQDLTATAAMRIGDASPLDATDAASSVVVLDRRSWASASVESFAYLAEPVADKLTGGGPLESALQPLGPALIGLQMGSLVGAMSQRVLASFDAGLPVGEHPPVAFVAPNLETFASDHDLDPRQARLWVALHEVTHHAQFAMPWIRDHFAYLIDGFVDGLELDPEAIQRRMEAFQDPEELQRALQDPSGFTGLLAGDDQSAPLGAIQAFMAVLEGYGDRLVERAAPGLIPQAADIRGAIDRSREEPSQGEAMLGQLLGLDLDHGRYGRGGTFCAEVARRWGDEALDRIWEGPEMLPTIDELDDQVGWAARVLL